MDISAFTKASNKFLKAEDVKNNPKAVFVITSEAEVAEKDYKGKKTLRVHIEGEFNKEARVFDMGKTNARVVEKALGSDTKKWVGHVLTLGIYQTLTSEGKFSDAISVKEVK